MAYNGFAYLYDDLNAAANYDSLCAALVAILRKQGIRNGIVADLGCGTGEVSLRLARAGYEVIAVDASGDMLSVFREKLEGEGALDVLLLQQDLAQLDLYGTIRAAVSTFDTFNHLPPDALREAVEKASLFIEPGGLLVFDANTPYKNREVLANQRFLFEDEDFCCEWQNNYRADIPATQVRIQAREGESELFTEQFLEYEYSLAFWQALLHGCGFTILEILDGESFGALAPTTQRFLFAAQKKKTREK